MEKDLRASACQMVYGIWILTILVQKNRRGAMVCPSPPCQKSSWCRGRGAITPRLTTVLALLLLLPPPRIAVLIRILLPATFAFALLLPSFLGEQSFLLPHGGPFFELLCNPLLELVGRRTTIGQQGGASHNVEARVIRLSRVALHSQLGLDHPPWQMFSNGSRASIDLVESVHQSQAFTQAPMDVCCRWSLANTRQSDPLFMVSQKTTCSATHCLMEFFRSSSPNNRKIGFFFLPAFHKPNSFWKDKCLLSGRITMVTQESLITSLQTFRLPPLFNVFGHDLLHEDFLTLKNHNTLFTEHHSSGLVFQDLIIYRVSKTNMAWFCNEPMMRLSFLGVAQAQNRSLHMCCLLEAQESRPGDSVVGVNLIQNVFGKGCLSLEYSVRDNIQIQPFNVMVWRQCQPNCPINPMEQNPMVPIETITVSWEIDKHLDFWDV